MINTINQVDIKNKHLDNDLKRLTISVKEFQQSIGLSYQKTMDLVHRDDFPKLKENFNCII